jgi:hypothetical protein
MKKCIEFAAEMHDYKIVEFKWQTVAYLKYQILDHSEQRFVCVKCGDVVAAWTKDETAEKMVTK